MADTVYDRIGGNAAIQLAVEDFYARMTADPMFAAQFRDVDLANLRGHQAMILALLTGGPAETSWPELPAIHGVLRRAHGGLRLSDDHFDRMAGHLVASLRQLAVDAADVEALAAALGEFRPDIVTVARDESELRAGADVGIDSGAASRRGGSVPNRAARS